MCGNWHFGSWPKNGKALLEEVGKVLDAWWHLFVSRLWQALEVIMMVLECSGVWR